MYKLSYYVPESHLEVTKSALFEVGAGRYQDYDQCCWQVMGMGQFRPLSSANPFLGKVGHIETCPEYRVEMLCRDEIIDKAIDALLASHPYEAVAYEAIRLDKYPRSLTN